MNTTSSISVVLAQENAVDLASLAALLQDIRPRWNITGRTSNLPDLMKVLDDCDPSLCIVDVRLQGQSSLDFMQRLGDAKPTIFVADESVYAVEAFNEDAIDFMTRPLRQDRLEQALKKAERHLDGIARAAESSAGSKAPLRQIVRMLKGQDVVLSPLSEVSYFQAQRKYTRVVLRQQEGLLRMGLSAVAEQLPRDQFLKIHRSLIVNMAHVHCARRDEFGRMTIGLAGRSEPLVIARTYEHLFRDGIY